MPKYFSGLVLLAGSIAPDFEYFLEFELSGSHFKDLFITHIPVTVFLSVILTFCLPILAIHLPNPLARRFDFLQKITFSTLLRKRGLVFLLSALTGIVGHLILDELFHPAGITFGISAAWLEDIILEDSLNLPRYVFFERIFSVILLIFLAWYAFSATSVSTSIQPVSPKKKTFFWIVTVLVWIALTIYNVHLQWPASINTIAVSATSGLLLSLLIITSILRIFSYHKLFSSNESGT